LIVTSSHNEPRERPGALAPLREPLFRNLWAANALSNIGGMVQGIGAAWLMTAMTAGDPRLVSLVQTAAALPVVLLSIVAGVLADTLDRRLVMLFGQATAILGAAGLVALTWVGTATPAILLVATFLIGSGYAVTNPGWYASFREQVSPGLLEPAVMLNALGFNLARSIGPAVGGLIIAVGGVIAAFAVNTLSYIPLFVALWRWRPAVPKRPIPPERFLPALAAGPRYIAYMPIPFAALFRSMMFGLIGSAIWALMPLVARNTLHGGPAMLGLLLFAFGLGAACGAVLRARLALDRAAMLAVCTIGYAIASAVLGYATIVPLALAACLLAGACWVAALSGLNVALQLHSARWVGARVVALLQVALFLGMGLGSAIWGALAGEIGLGNALGVSGGVMLLSLGLAKLTPLPEEDEPDLSPLHPEPPLLDMDWRAGPVRTRVTYRVPAEHHAVFADALCAIGRLRRRDGARHWSLSQGDQHWVESFETPCLLDDLHRRGRITAADAALREKLATLSEGPPKVERSIGGVVL